MKPGYKQTEVGVIPEEWEVRKLEQCTDTQRPICYGIVQTGPDLLVGIPCLRVVDINEGRIDKRNLVKTSRQISESYRRTILKAGDLVMPLRGKVGDVAIIDGELAGANLTRGVSLIAPNSTCDSGYCRQFMAWSKTGQRLERSMNGSALQEIPIATLRSFTIALPHSAIEQRAIAEALSDVDELLGGLERLITKKRGLKQAAMQQLLTAQTRLPGFDGEWHTQRLGNVSEMSSGGTPPSSNPAYYDGDVPWVSISDMTKGGKYILCTDRNLTKEGLANSTAEIFPTGSILYTMYASIGECSIARIPVATSQAILGIRPKAALNADFLFYYLSSLKAVVKSLGQQGTQANLNKGMVEDFTFKFPPPAEQTAIAEVLSDMDAELAALEVRRSKTRDLKQAMMQDLLTGRVRLV